MHYKLSGKAELSTASFVGKKKSKKIMATTAGWSLKQVNCGILSEHIYFFASLTPAPASTLSTVDSGEADDDWGDFESSSPALSCSTSIQQSILPTPLASNQSNVIQPTPFNLEAQPQAATFSSSHLKSLPSVSVSPTNFAVSSRSGH